MIAFYVAVVLTVAALAALVLFVRPPQTDQTAPATQTAEAATNSLPYALGVVVASFLIALIAPEPVSPFYKGAILLGMVLTLIAAGLSFSRFLPDYAAHAHLIWVYWIYFLAFTAHTRWQLPTPWALLILVGLGILYWQLGRALREVWWAVLIYALILALTGWQALELVVQNGAVVWTWAALAGIVLAAGAHTLQAIHSYRRPLTGLPVAQIAFLLAQTALGWSVWGQLG